MGHGCFPSQKMMVLPPHPHVDGIKYVTDLVARPFSETSIFFLAKTKEEDFYAEP